MITGNLWFKMPLAAFSVSRLLPDMARRQISQPDGTDMERVIPARVDWGRWIWDCECGGAEFAFDEGLGMCQNCYNGKSGHKYRPIIFPKKRPAIEKLLLIRPLENRNWSPGETIEKLRAENQEHKGELL